MINFFLIWKIRFFGEHHRHFLNPENVAVAAVVAAADVVDPVAGVVVAAADVADPVAGVVAVVVAGAADLVVGVVAVAPADVADLVVGAPDYHVVVADVVAVELAADVVDPAVGVVAVELAVGVVAELAADAADLVVVFADPDSLIWRYYYFLPWNCPYLICQND